MLGHGQEGKPRMSENPENGAPQPYRRVLLKLSGDCFTHAGDRGISMHEVVRIAAEVQAAQRDTKCEIAVVIGGGNILRGAQFKERSEAIQEATAHYMGMLATVINGLALQDALEHLGSDTRLMSAIRMDGVCEPYIRRRGWRHLQKQRIIILAAGTGGPYVTTDTAASLRALELECEVLLKATRVDGVYSDDPEKNPHAVLYQQLDYPTVLERDLRVMDRSAIAHCMGHDLPVVVFNYRTEGNILRAIRGEKIGTRIVAQNNGKRA
jgi:uridylate kinase